MKKKTYEKRIIEILDKAIKLALDNFNHSCPKDNRVCFWQDAYEDLLKLVKEAERKGYWESVKEQEESEDMMKAEEAHRTAEGYCCACGYDMAVMEERIEEAYRRGLDAGKREVKVKNGYQERCGRLLKLLPEEFFE